ncbi:RagB/SusD family nutrient uptake outer membrane protein [Belliella sp. R4-6]|uniref:RagB/SusD family nutrient uptake outer membrane protein n=1 Tax=Belliella alkalica TaxID=1730871 RepID=A0ABS9VFS6_9BACT|nr:RagB/SusD family nutrient uptake outer membrane protein [Belliella alkalica]MCH7415289.1 RagB/SusD family nutrient uptake outer membrane protein [Belliella alkalica]
MKKLTYITIVVILSSCADFLDERPNKNIVIPETLDELQALLDASPRGMNESPGVHQISSDDFVTTDNGFTGFRNIIEQNAYIWSEEIFENLGLDWSTPYLQIFYANIVLEGLNNYNSINQDEEERKKVIEGRALFYRAFAYYNLAICFTDHPDNNLNNTTKLGLPLKLSPDINEPIARAELSETFERIIEDLEGAVLYLPENYDFMTRPSKRAAYAMLSRVHLYLKNYQRSLEFADLALGIDDELLDYNNVQTSSLFSFNLENPEIIFFNQMLAYSWNSSTLSFVNPEIYEMYADGDLRKEVFFRNRGFGINFLGNYTGGIFFFTGLANNEVMLNRAECLVRLGEEIQGIEQLNTLLAKRYRVGSFDGIENQQGESLLQLVLKERRKELLFRGIRWADLKRLNTEPGLEQTLRRVVFGTEYVLEPNSPRYVFPIPPQEINQSGIQQNQR